MRTLTDGRVARPLALCIAGWLLFAGPALGQRAEPGWSAAQFRLQPGAAAPAHLAPSYLTASGGDSAVIRPTHWLVGGTIGGGLAGIAGGALAVGFCGMDGPCRDPGTAALGGFLIMGLLGFGIGALIGGQFPKH